MRLFVAIELSERVRSALGELQAAWKENCSDVRWIPPERLHLTVKFLGEVPDQDVTETAEAVVRAARNVPPFDMKITGCGCFPPRGPVRIVWVGVCEQSGVLLRCIEHVERELTALGFARERRRFSPHLTIGRVRNDPTRGALRSAIEARGFPPMEQWVSSLTLMSSVLSPKGPTYTPVSTSRLGQVQP